MPVEKRWVLSVGRFGNTRQGPPWMGPDLTQETVAQVLQPCQDLKPVDLHLARARPASRLILL